MNVDTAALRHFGVDDKPLDEGHLREFMKILCVIFTSSTSANIKFCGA
jgi:hypothetical protein